MITIVKDGRKIAKFESWEGNKAMDWITAKGLFIEHKLYMGNETFWEVKPLP